MQRKMASDELVGRVLSHPEQALIALDRIDSAERMSRFVELAWPHIDPQPYQPNWHMEAICDHLEAVARGELTRVLFNVPPGTSKSSATSVFFPAWLWGPAGMPHMRFIGAAHEQTLATRDNLRTRRLIQSDWFQKRWPTTLTSDQNEKTYFENDRFGFRQSSAVASMTGKRGHVVVWDDPQNPESTHSDLERDRALRIFDETLPSRVVDPKTSAIIVIMQRLHENDVAGHILARELGYTVLMLPMEFEPERRCYTVVLPRHLQSEPVRARFYSPKQIWFPEDHPVPAEYREVVEKLPVETVYNQDPRTEDGELLHPERFPREVVERDKRAMGSYATAGQMQQRPVPRGGGMFKRHWFPIVPAAPIGTRWVRGWDLAGTKKNTAAYTAGVLLGEKPNGGYIIGHATRLQGSPNEVERLILNTARDDGKDVHGSLPQDPGQAGKMQVQYLIGVLAGFTYTASPESGDKVSRAEPFAAQAEAGNVEIVKGDWNKDYLDELETFPFGKFLDQVDATSRAFGELISRPRYETNTAGLPI